MKVTNRFNFIISDAVCFSGGIQNIKGLSNALCFADFE